MFKKSPLLSRFVAYIVLPVLIAFAWIINSLLSSLPVTGDVVAPGIQKQAEVARDEWGIPVISAASDRDAFYTLGFLHAQDRMWQLEVQRRLAGGALSEVFGRNSLDTDIWFRTLGIYPSAEDAWNSLSPDAQASLQAYTDGINGWLSTTKSLPIEFKIMDVTPQPWTPIDSLAWTKVFALNLSGNYLREIDRLFAEHVLDPSQLWVFFDGVEDDRTPQSLPMDNSEQSVPRILITELGNLDTFLQDWQKLQNINESLLQDFQIGGRFAGSNGWVVGPQHTQSGNAQLANDPHLGIQIPSLWYAANLKGHKLNVSGMTLVGLPLVIFGRNHDITWGGTNMMADVQDLVVEESNPLDTQQYKVNGEWQKFATRSEIIHIRADMPTSLNPPIAPVKIQVRSTHNGPVISDSYRALEHPVALKWTALTQHDTSYEAFFELNYARDWQGFESAASKMVAPVLNLLYSDRQGNIGYLGAGDIPIRKSGKGAYPVPGDDDNFIWLGTIPKDDMPRQFNPESGFIVSANNNPVDQDYPYFISNDFASDARAKRIETLLNELAISKQGIRLEDMQAIQADTLSLSARTLQPVLNAFLATETANSENYAEVYGLMQHWQGEMTSDSPAAAIFQAWTRHLRQALFADELNFYWNKPHQSGVLDRLVKIAPLGSITKVLSSPDSAWCNNITTASNETCQDIALSSLDDALWELEKLSGKSIYSDWRWGDLHQARYDHIPFSEVKVLRDIFGRKVENGGSVNTINVASASFQESEGYIQRLGAGFRQVMELGEDSIRHWHMNSTGQSGNVFSDHYDDMLQPFHQVLLVPMPTTSELNTDDRLTLLPSVIANAVD